MLIAIHLSKQEKLDADPKTIQQFDFTGNLENNTRIFFIIAEANKNSIRFFKRNG